MGSQSSFDNGRRFISGSEMVTFFKKIFSILEFRKEMLNQISSNFYSLRSAMDLYSDDEDEVLEEARTSMASRYANSLNCTASL